MDCISKTIKINSEIKSIIKELKKGKKKVWDIPEEFALDPSIVRIERQLGLRKSGHRGFDVITQKFFVEEQWFCGDLPNEVISEWNKMTFDSFEEYYKFLDGDVYEDAW